jgi:hypothetical protein
MESDAPIREVAMKDHDEESKAAGHADSPRQDAPGRPPARPAGAPEAPGERHADGPLPSTGRQPERPGQVGRFEPRPGARDPETLKPSDE